MMVSLIKRLFTFLKPQKKLNIIILGTDHAEHSLYKYLQAEGGYKVLFFIDLTPWQLKFNIPSSMCHAINELVYLCENNEIYKVFYINDMWEEKTSNLPIIVNKLEKILTDLV